MYLSDSVSVGQAIEEDFAQWAQTLSAEERVSAFNAHMNKHGQRAHDADAFGQSYHTADGMPRPWLVASYEADDVVFHDSYIVHASSKNEDSLRRIRVSTDLRFYEEGSSADDRWMKLWTPGDRL